jgi:MFS family permease
MTYTPKIVERTYVALMFGNTLAASFIWGVNTLFLLDAGLSNFEAFAANAFFTLGMVLFEIPTGIVADSFGRRTSYLLGTVTLAVTTFLYYLLWQVHAPFWQWAAASMLLGLGFTFFSGAVEAWLVDALAFVKYEGSLEAVFGKGQIVGGIAMLGGSVLGGVAAQLWSLGSPFIIRAGILVLLFLFAAIAMRDLGFTPDRSERPLRAIRTLWRTSLQHGIHNPPVRWVMIAAPFTASVGFYVFYALQPYLLELYGDEKAYSIAGLAAACIAAAQIVGGILAPRIRRLFRTRTAALMFAVGMSSAILVAISLTHMFVVALVLVALWGIIFAATMPIRQAYLNDLIPSKQRATVLSFDSLMGNTGSIIVQPGLGKAADFYSYGGSFAIGAAIQLIALPALLQSRRNGSKADVRSD